MSGYPILVPFSDAPLSARERSILAALKSRYRDCIPSSDYSDARLLCHYRSLWLHDSEGMDWDEWQAVIDPALLDGPDEDRLSVFVSLTEEMGPELLAEAWSWDRLEDERWMATLKRSELSKLARHPAVAWICG